MGRIKHRIKVLKTRLNPAKSLDPIILGYVAGIVDGEGYVARNVVTIYNNSMLLLAIMQLVIGGHISPSGNRLGLKLSLRAEERVALLPQIIPYLIIKKQKAIECLEYTRNGLL